MADTPQDTTDEKEFEIVEKLHAQTIDEYRHLQNVRFGVIGGTLTVFIGLMTAIQLTFPREAPIADFSAIATPARLYLLSLIPKIGMFLTLASMILFGEWYIARRRIVKFGERLEVRLTVLHMQYKERMFQSMTFNYDWLNILTSLIILCMLFMGFFMWNGVRIEINAYRYPKQVVTQPIPFTKDSPKTPTLPQKPQEK